jgi:adenylate cyclase
MASQAIGEAAWAELQRVRRAVLVLDVVESVRLFEADESGTARRWSQLVNDIRARVLAPLQGRLVKSLGDGLLLEFEQPAQAAKAALQIGQRATEHNHGLPPESQIRLRMGVHVAEVLEDELDIYGAGVNLAARLAGLAGPDEIVVSADARAQLVDGLDAEVEDLGDCWLKNISNPVRAFRLGPAMPGGRRRVHGLSGGATETVCMAVLPFEHRARDGGNDPLGHLLADDIIAQMSRVPQLRLISRLSTAAFRNRPAGMEAIAQALAPDYVMHGSYARAASRVRLTVHLTEVTSGAVIYTGGFEADEQKLLFGDQPEVDRLVQEACSTLVGIAIQRACTQPLPTLTSYTILLGAVSLLHSLSPLEFERSREMLAYLIERHPTQATPRAWLGLWHVMRVGQGWSPDKTADANQGRAHVRQALSIEPSHSLSLAVDGLICAYVQKDLVTAGERYDASLRANPSESLAWLYKSAWHAYQEQGEMAVDSALRAQSLSPLDPLRYYYDNFTSTAMLSNGDLDGAIQYGLQSLRANKMHGPTLRILAVAHSLAGDMEAARRAIKDIQALEPGFTVGAFRARYPGSNTGQVERYAGALAAAGLPL